MYKHKKDFLNFALVVACLFIKPVMAVQLLCEEKLAQAAMPQSAFYLPENEALHLQNALNTHNVVRLKPGGDYRRSLTIKLASNQALYGLVGTKLPQVIIPAGTTNAILSGVSPEKISFNLGTFRSNGVTKPIKGNCFNRISNSAIEAKNTTLENNLFTDLSNVAIAIDTSQKGYLKNNLFIRTMQHAAYPAITLIGDRAKQSAGNQFIWTNMLTPQGEGIIIKNQKDISFIGLDAESWNWNHKAVYPGMLNVFNTDFLSVFMSNGGDNHNNTGQYFNLDAKNIFLQGMRIGRTQNTGLILGEHAENLVSIDTLNIGLTKNNLATQVIDIFSQGNANVTENNQDMLPEKLSYSAKQAVTAVLQAEQSAYRNWNKPQFENIPNPAGDNWQLNRTNQPDSSDYIQSLIDQNGIAELDAGIYYISKPLNIKDGQGIIGAGANNTAIIATSSDIDLISGATHSNADTTITSFVLADITLQGGRNGINHSAQGSGQGADYNHMTLSHVTIRNMSNAGILIDNIYAWDNNYIDYIHFYRCKTGIKQRPDINYAGGDHIGITFLDKNVFYRSQFIENGVAIDWQAKRGNNLNAFINCLFKDNQQLMDVSNTDSAFFANSVFEMLPGKQIKTNRVLGFVNSLFVMKDAKHIIFDGLTYCDHCTIDNTLSDSGVIASPDSKYSFFINNTLLKPDAQPIDTGLILNSNFSATRGNQVVNEMYKNKQKHQF